MNSYIDINNLKIILIQKFNKIENIILINYINKYIKNIFIYCNVNFARSLNKKFSLFFSIKNFVIIDI